LNAPLAVKPLSFDEQLALPCAVASCKLGAAELVIDPDKVSEFIEKKNMKNCCVRSLTAQHHHDISRHLTTSHDISWHPRTSHNTSIALVVDRASEESIGNQYAIDKQIIAIVHQAKNPSNIKIKSIT